MSIGLCAKISVETTARPLNADGLVHCTTYAIDCYALTYINCIEIDSEDSVLAARHALTLRL